MGDYLPTATQREAHRWCIDNCIHIWPTETKQNSGVWHIDIQIYKGPLHRAPEEFGPVEIWEKIYEYYEYYYVKNRESRSSAD